MTKPTKQYFPGIRLHFFGRIEGEELPEQKLELRNFFYPLHQKLLRDELEKEGVAHAEKIPLYILKQVHSNKVLMITNEGAKPSTLKLYGDISENFSPQEHPEGDGLITQSRNLSLGIYVADCAPVWVVEQRGRAAALLHSGKKGTLAGILPEALERFDRDLGISPERLHVIIGPAIRPPYYEIDFVAMIHQQAKSAGVKHIEDHGICTASHLDRYYSYRKEKGNTGRMLATATLLYP